MLTFRLNRPISGFPEDFQPQCKSEVTFNVNASTILGEEILVFGSSITIGSGDDIMNAVELTADNYPIWSITVDMPANTEVSFQYVRAELDGSYVYEKENRTILTGYVSSVHFVPHEQSDLSCGVIILCALGDKGWHAKSTLF